MVAKVRIKAGSVEFEYESETELKISDIKDLFSHIETLFTVPSLAAPIADAPADLDAIGEKGGPKTKSLGHKLHTNSIAKKLSAKTGPELAVAAAAFLQIMEGKDSFSRSELLKAMQSATMHYKESMNKNLTSHLGSLVGKKFNQLSADKYSLNADVFKSLEIQLAE